MTLPCGEPLFAEIGAFVFGTPLHKVKRCVFIFSIWSKPSYKDRPGTRVCQQRLEMDEVLTVAEQLAREQDKVDAFIADVE